MPLAPGRASMVALASPPPILPLMSSNTSDWPSALMVPPTCCNSTSPGNTPRSAWKATRPRQPLTRPAPSGSELSWPAAPTASAKAGASASVSRPISPSIDFSSSSASASRPRKCEPLMLLSRSSRVHLLPATLSRADRPMPCASVSPGFRPSSGARLTLLIFKFALALSSGANGSTEPCASASSPVPEILALTCSGAPHAPAACPSKRAAPSPAATTPSSPSSASSVVPCGDDSLVSTTTSLRRSASTSMPWIAATGGFAAMVVTPLSCGVSRSSTRRALARSACAAFFSSASASLARAGPGPAATAFSRAASDGANGAINAVSWLNEAALEFSVRFPVALTRSNCPAPSSETLSGWPIFNCSSVIVFGP